MVASVAGIRFVDDSKATNADAAARALGCYQRVIWIAGGIAKVGGINSLAPLFPRVEEALLIGRDADMFAVTLAQYGVTHRVVGNLENAVPAAWKAAADHNVDTVLLSPACASFDQYPGFEARGKHFSKLARALEGSG